MPQTDRQNLAPVRGQLLRDKLFKVCGGDLQPSNMYLDGYFPAAGGAEEDLVGPVVSDESTRAFGEPGVVTDPPNKCMSIEQNSQSSNAF